MRPLLLRALATAFSISLSLPILTGELAHAKRKPAAKKRSSASSGEDHPSKKPYRQHFYNADGSLKPVGRETLLREMFQAHAGQYLGGKGVPQSVAPQLRSFLSAVALDPKISSHPELADAIDRNYQSALEAFHDQGLLESPEKIAKLQASLASIKAHLIRDLRVRKGEDPEFVAMLNDSSDTSGKIWSTLANDPGTDMLVRMIRSVELLSFHVKIEDDQRFRRPVMGGPESADFGNGSARPTQYQVPERAGPTAADPKEGERAD